MDRYDYHKYIEKKVEGVKSVVRGLNIHDAEIILSIVVEDIRMKKD